ncbi:MAG: leucine-rich repeat protein [Christensenellales bacterium]|jgi:uncharacterized repeat protein (TIGR02543 family)
MKRNKKIKKSTLKIILAVLILTVIAISAYFAYDFIKLKEKTITINVMGVSDEITVNVKTGRIINLDAPEKEGYDFIGWYYDEQYYKPFDPLKNFVFKELTIYAKMQIKSYTMTFVTDGGSAVNPVEFEYNDIPAEPAPPEKPDYMFAGWYLDSELSEKHSFDTVINEDFTLYAAYTLISDSLTYTLNYGKMTITGKKAGISTYVYIPREIEGYRVGSIGYEAFKDLDTLKEIYILDKDLSIESGIIKGCDALEKITIPLVNAGSSGHNMIAFFFGGAAIPDSLKTITIIEGLTSLSEAAFNNILNVETITLPKSLTIIGEYAFVNCQKLKNIVIPENVTSIGANAFLHCYSLSEMSIPAKVEVIPEYAFSNCNNLTEVTLPEGLLRIKDYAFNECNLLEKINLPGSLETIGAFAFYEANALNNIVIPSKVKEIKNYTFYNCSSLSDIQLSDGLTTIGEGAFYDCASLKRIEFPDSLTTIKMSAFNDCSSLDNIVLPPELNTLNPAVFANCATLRNITLNENLTTIETYAFGNCGALRKITIPSGVEEVKGAVFAECDLLDEIEFKGEVSPEIETFVSINQYLKIYVPDDSLNAYKQAWPEYIDYIYPVSDRDS